jgi:methionyl-tRNA synthetase
MDENKKFYNRKESENRMFYITTAIPYVNGKPHIGHALEYFQADTVRNYQKLLGKATLLLSGADENALKNVQAAEKEGTPIQDFLNKNSEVFRSAFEKLGVKIDVFERGSDSLSHFPGVQKLWNLCLENGDIYKKEYTGLYCVGCESFKTETDLVDGKCPDHLTVPEKITEENYFFKLSNYQKILLEKIESNEIKIIPENKKSEIVSFISSGLEDFSISRSKERAKGVGVPVPGDPNQVMYVWFDALAIYITGIGYGTDEEKFQKWWPADVHVIGKDINRFHTVYWPAMLLSAKLPLPKCVLIHGFITSNGQKMSKTLGNVIDPFEMVEKFGLEPFRYFLLSQIPTNDDGDFTQERFKEVYTSELSNGLGNLVARIAKLAENNNVSVDPYDNSFVPEVEDDLKNFRFNIAIQRIRGIIATLDKSVNENKPWELKGDDAVNVITVLSKGVQQVAFNLQPFLPETARKILNQFSGEIKSSSPLFPRLG